MNESPGAEEIQRRIERLQQALQERAIKGGLLAQKMDVYYFSGTDQDAHLWIPAAGEPILMVRKSLERAREQAALARIVPLAGFSQIPEHIGAIEGPVGLELDVLPVRMYFAYQKACPRWEPVDISSLIRQIRMIKSAYEIACIRRAAAMADDLFAHIPRFLKESETEVDLALRAEGYYRERGHFGLVRFRGFNMESVYGHILAGPSGAVPSASAGPTGGTGLGPYCSQGAGRRRLLPGEPIMVDYVGSAEGYCSDQTRIFSIGPLPDNLQSVFEVMLEVQEALIREGKPGVKARNLYEVALRTARQGGVSEGFMGYPQGVPFVGHGVGLELDEWPLIGPRSDHVLAQGMVFALEPKCILPGEGAVGIENTFVVTEKGLEKVNLYPDAVVSC